MMPRCTIITSLPMHSQCLHHTMLRHRKQLLLLKSLHVPLQGRQLAAHLSRMHKQVHRAALLHSPHYRSVHSMPALRRACLLPAIKPALGGLYFLLQLPAAC